MAITKLRLQQIQDEVSDFAAAELANHNASPETLHDTMKNLTRNLKRRFGTEGAGQIENYYGQEAAHGTLAHYASGEAVDLLIKHEAAAQKIMIDAAGAIEESAGSSFKAEALAGDMDLDASADVLVDAGAEIKLAAVSHITASAGGDMDLVVAGAQSVAVTGAIVETGASMDADYTGAYSVYAGAASDIKTSTGALTLEAESGNLVATAFATMDLNSVDFDVDASGTASIIAVSTGEYKAAGLELSSSVNTEIKANGNINNSAGAVFAVNAESYDGNIIKGLAIDTGEAAAITVATGNLSLVTSADDISANSAGSMFLQAASVLSASAEGIEIEANAGALQLKGAFVLADSDSQIEATAADEMLLKSTSGFIDLSAEGSFLRFDDSFRALNTTGEFASGGYYEDGIKLADNQQDWLDWEAAFGNKPLLKAIAEAASGNSSSARFVGTVNAAFAGGEVLKSSNVDYMKLTAGAASDLTGASASHTVADYTAAEMDYSVEVYVNGQRLAQTEDFEVTDGSTAAFTDGGTTMDVNIKFALEADDVIEVIVK